MEAQPDLVYNSPKGDLGGSPSNPRKENDDDDSDKSHKDDMGGSENPSAEGDIHPTPESSESHNLDNQPLESSEFHNLDNQLLESSECCHLDHEITLHVFPGRFTKEKHVVPPETPVHFVLEYIVLFVVLRYISLLYIIRNYSLEFRQVV